MADVFTKILGIIGNTLHIGGPTGPTVNNNGGTVEIKDSTPSSFTALRAAHIDQGPNSATLDDVPTLLDLQGRIPNIHFSFLGAAPPSPGDNTGYFGICKTTGGDYTAGDVIYDNGAALEDVTHNVCQHLTTEVAVTNGDISLIEDGVYAWESSAWVLKGDGTAGDSGLTKMIKVHFDHETLTPSSSTSIPTNAIVVRAQVNVTEAFNGTPAATLLVQSNSQTLMATGDSKPSTVNIYQVPQQTTITSGAVVAITCVNTGGSTGEGDVIVEYVTPLA